MVPLLLKSLSQPRLPTLMYGRELSGTREQRLPPEGKGEAHGAPAPVTRVRSLRETLTEIAARYGKPRRFRPCTSLMRSTRALAASRPPVRSLDLTTPNHLGAQ